MLDIYYTKLSEEEKQFAIHRLANRANLSELCIKMALEFKNPMIAIDQGMVVINRNSFDRLLAYARKNPQNPQKSSAIIINR